MTGQMLRVAAVTPLSPLVTRFRFEHPEGAALPLFSGGAHVVVEMPDQGTLRRNASSDITTLPPSVLPIARQRVRCGRWTGLMSPAVAI